MSRFEFTVSARDQSSHARTGRLTTPHGDVDTPAFMPVGTRATVKGTTPDQLVDAGAQIILSNTYHLALRPGADVVAEMGGLHRFMSWSGPILTDSGGFQVFSLATLNAVDDEGVTFKSHIDGAVLRLTPASAIDVQQKLGADIIMAFDQCPPLPAAPDVLLAAVDRTIRWARACRDAKTREDQALFGIVQGGLDYDLRCRCLDALIDLDFPGYAVGGLSVGEKPEQMADLLARFAHRMPVDRPRYLMGVGRPIDIMRAVASGIDMFDCVLPTRNGRNAFAFHDDGFIRIRNSQFRTDEKPLVSGCDCYTCKRFSRAYLRHLFLAGEMLGPILVSLHNIAYYQRLMRRIRQAIAEGTYKSMLDEYETRMTAADVSEEL